MSLKILFADDSVTAQNMGKKILTEAGYEVVAVSNGAAAVKKIAEQKPDIIILDVYMPGYSGLEVCEKVRSSIATIKTPVLLTVGKMEPYKPEDANRVRADGVIIKPFEASDLLAIIKKFEERIGQMAAPPPPPPPAARPAAEEIEVHAPETHHEPTPMRSMQPMVEVPDHMATSSAFSELLGTDASHMEHFAPAAVAQQQVVAAAPAVATPDYAVPASWRAEPEPQPTVTEPVPEQKVEEPVLAEVQEIEAVPAEAHETAAAATPGSEQSEAAPARPVQIPVYQEPEQSHYEFVPTAAEPAEVSVEREPGLQESDAETTRNTVAEERDADLVPTAHHISPPLRHANAAAVGESVSPEQSAAASSVAETSDVMLEPEITSVQEIAQSPAGAERVPLSVPASFSEAEFEARVAAAMAAYGNRGPEVAAAEATVQAAAPAEASIPEPNSSPAEPTPAFEYHPAATAAVAEEKHADTFVAVPAQVSAPEDVVSIVEDNSAEEPVTQNHDAIAARVEAELPATVHAVTEAAAGEEHANIADAVHRVMERMKHNLVEEIVRELKSKK